MKRIIAFIFVMVAFLFVLCGCIPQPFVKQTFVTTGGSTTNGEQTDSTVNKPSVPMRRVYVSGAVIADGFVDVPIICDHQTLLKIVGITSHSAVPENSNRLLSQDVDVYLVDFISDGVVCASVNVNSVYVLNRFDVEGVSEDIVNKLADYIEVNGAITNRLQLKSVLGDDYDYNYYKFYIDIADYA